MGHSLVGRRNLRVLVALGPSARRGRGTHRTTSSEEKESEGGTMRTIIGIDPGPIKSAYVVWDGKVIHEFGKVENVPTLIEDLDRLEHEHSIDEMVIEEIKNYGLPAGDTILKTVLWSGRLGEAWGWDCLDFIMRKTIAAHLCGSARAKDGNIRQALIDRFEPDLQPRQRPKGMLKGISADVWQALAVCTTFWDQQYGTKKT